MPLEVRLENQRPMKQKIVFATAAAVALTLSACAPVTIARINQDPSRFRNRTVHVDGTVVTSVGFLRTGGYQIDDGTGKIYVVSRSGVPSSGSRVSVTGRVMPGAEVLGQALGTAIVEQSHSIK
jgi:ABC-type Zn2+ transport system substrate-binding protein/surface adhesin